MKVKIDNAHDTNAADWADVEAEQRDGRVWLRLNTYDSYATMTAKEAREVAAALTSAADALERW